MLNTLNNLSYNKARYIFIRELDTGGPIGEIWLMRDQQIVNTMMDVMCFIDEHINDPEEPINRLPNIPLLDQDVFDKIMTFNLDLPTTILLESELDWNTFISAYFSFIRYGISVSRNLLNYARGPQNEKEIDSYQNRLDDLSRSFEAVIKLVELGAGYTDLINAGYKVSKILSEWNQSKPAAVQLSEAYLKAIGYFSGPYENEGHTPEGMPIPDSQVQLEQPPQQPPMRCE